MWPDSSSEAARDTGHAAAPHGNAAIRRDYPDQQAVDYYLAKASAMRARSMRRVCSQGWTAVRRFVRRQLSPYRRVKLPSGTV